MSDEPTGRRGIPVPYIVVCAVLGAALGWVPKLLHGPIPYKFDLHYLDGAWMIWAFYSARMLIGLLVGMTSWPRPWWIRGPLCGLLVMFPVIFISLATPECGPGCAATNLGTATGVGFAVGGIAFALTGRHRA